MLERLNACCETRTRPAPCGAFRGRCATLRVFRVALAIVEARGIRGIYTNTRETAWAASVVS